jgi:hypothetical protein
MDSFELHGSLVAGGGGVLVCGKPGATSVASGVKLTVTNNNFARCVTAPINGGVCSGSAPLAWEPLNSASVRAQGADTSGYYANGGVTRPIDMGGTGFSSPNGMCGSVTYSGNVWDDNGATVPCAGGF